MRKWLAEWRARRELTRLVMGFVVESPIHQWSNRASQLCSQIITATPYLATLPLAERLKVQVELEKLVVSHLAQSVNCETILTMVFCPLGHAAQQAVYVRQINSFYCDTCAHAYAPEDCSIWKGDHPVV